MGSNVSNGWITCSVGGDASIVCAKMYYTSFEKYTSIRLHFLQSFEDRSNGGIVYNYVFVQGGEDCSVASDHLALFSVFVLKLN